ncbi:MAG: PAS domain S-box protein, partial [Phycisphaerae bacterium]
IRLRDGDDYPYYEAHGFPEEFVQKENYLCVRDADGTPVRDSAGKPILECMCGNVIGGRFDPSLPFFTPAGSFWTNGTTALLAGTTDADRQTPTRNRCNREGYESVALIALRVGEQRLGLLQLNDRRPNMFTLETIAQWERLAGYLAVALAQTRAEETLRASEARFRALFENAMDAMLLGCTDGRIVAANPSACAMFGMSEAELIRIGRAGICDPDDSRIGGALEERERTSKFRGEVRFVRKDGSKFPAEIQSIAQQDCKGCSFVVVRDITERKRIEEAQALLAAIVESSDDAILSKHLDGTILSWNAAAERLFGYSAQEIIGQPVTLLLPPESMEEEQQLIARLRRGERYEHVETIRMAKDGRRIEVSITVSPLKDHAGQVIGASTIVRDITKRKQAEEALRRSEERYRSLFESMDEGFALCEMIYDGAGQAIDFRYLNVNPAFEKLTGLPVANVIGKRVTEVIPGIESTWIEQFDHIVRTGHSQRIVNQVATLGREFEVYAYCLTPGRFAAVFMDVTERLRAEEALAAAKVSAEQAKAAAEHASQAKDHFLAVLSHELRNPLNPVLMTAAMLRDDPRFDADIRAQLEVICRNTELEARLIDDLLDVTRIERGKVELDRRPVELGPVIHHAVEVCMSDIKARQLVFSVDIDSDGPCLVDADAARLQQVFWNLIKNAIKFTPAGGQVGITSRRDSDGYVVVQVKDSGVGIEPATLVRIFNAFEQAERSITRQFGGLGLGLAISKALVEMHGGRIAADSAGSGKGATFTVRLPLLPVASAVATTPSASPVAVPKAPTRSLRILLVEDHEDTARIMCRLLEADGHKVRSAADVASALALSAQ